MIILPISSLDLGEEYAQVGRHGQSINNSLTQAPLLSGRYAADASVWSAIVTMLATLDLNLAKDADGNDITFQATFVNGATECVRIVLVIGFWRIFQIIPDAHARSLVGSPLVRTSTKKCLI